MPIMKLHATLAILTATAATSAAAGPNLGEPLGVFKDGEWLNVNWDIRSSLLLDCEEDTTSTPSTASCAYCVVFGTGANQLSHCVGTECRKDETTGVYSNCTCEAKIDGEECTAGPCEVCDDKELDEAFETSYKCNEDVESVCPEEVRERGRHLMLDQAEFTNINLNTRENLLFDWTATATGGFCATFNETEHCVNITCEAAGTGGDDEDNIYKECNCNATLNGKECTNQPCEVLGFGDPNEALSMSYDCGDLRGGVKALGGSGEVDPPSDARSKTAGQTMFLFVMTTIVLLLS